MLFAVPPGVRRRRRTRRVPPPNLFNARRLRLKIVLLVLGVVALLLGFGVRAWWLADGPVPMSLDFEGNNGETGSLPAEVIVDEDPARTATATCTSKKANEPSNCEVKLELVPGRHTFRVRLRTPQGWTPWSEPTPGEVKGP
jgi:hypothetical protein